MHAVRDPAIDLVEELVNEDVGRDLLQHATVRVHEADIPSAGNAEVRVAGLAGAVDRAAEHRDLEVLRVAHETPLHRFCELLYADVVAAAGRAGDQDRPSLA